MRFLRRNWSDASFTLIPENERMTDAEKQGKILVQQNIDGSEYRIRITGKADLRVESADSKYIVDFKTGRAKAEQLIFYEWLYYLLDDPTTESQLKSVIWLILQMRVDDSIKIKDEKRKKYLENISEALTACFEYGYRLAAKSTDRSVMRDISRSDLYLPGVHNETL
ncbi:MAG: PD-(D/E)XK nuclease family protein [Candidatus Cloacimonetes bacterium]|nr:PD-(D/E)XK nuclease family protein [Candidatus Cloacimonadota bacterium]